ncbi:hypothetical protein ACFQ2O_15935 [Pontibacter rugosus]|uniref:Uncharacterized protein n=1 Tax=Pontibacter rugosus TaxID=1745966 RepID=A0ABW3SUV9_9BACT
MQSRRTYRIVMTIVCFIFAAMNAYRIIIGEFEWLDVFLMVVFLAIGAIYVIGLLRSDSQK